MTENYNEEVIWSFKEFLEIHEEQMPSNKARVASVVSDICIEMEKPMFSEAC